jgi:hypothetical protein
MRCRDAQLPRVTVAATSIRSGAFTAPASRSTFTSTTPWRLETLAAQSAQCRRSENPRSNLVQAQGGSCRPPSARPRLSRARFRHRARRHAKRLPLPATPRITIAPAGVDQENARDRS